MLERNFELFLDKIHFLKKEGISFCVATMVDSRGSAPQNIGARAVVTAQGLVFGTIGGGKIEFKIITISQSLLKTGRHEKQFLKLNLQQDVGMSCGGEVSFFIETFHAKKDWTIAIFGAGHVGQALVPLVQKLDCNIIVFDTRSEWLDKISRGSNINCILSQNLSQELRQLPSDAFVALMTMGHVEDLPILETALKHHNFPYLGVIGSQIKAKKLKAELIKREVSKEKLDNFFCPIGEDFGSNSPIEIAFSIVAQLLKTRDKYFERHRMHEL